MADPLLVGFAEVDVSPSAEAIAADGTRRKRSFPVYDHLKARVLALRQGARTAAIVGLDVFELGIGFERQLLDLLAGSGLSEESLFLCPSHVGATPISNYGAYLIVFAQDLLIESYERECAQRVAAGIRRALDSLQPAAVSAGVARAPDVLHNRRFIRPDGKVEMIGVGRRPAQGAALVEQGVDDTVAVLRFDAVDGGELGALVNFGCHAVCSSDKYGGITADYPQYVAEVFTKVIGVPAVFSQGGLGDLVPNLVNGTAAQRIGRAVGAQALYAFEQAQPLEALDLRVAYREVDVPARIVAEESESLRTELRNSHARYRRFLFEQYAQHPTIRYPLRLLSLGDLAIVHLPGEVFHSTALAIKEASPFRHTVVVCRATREVGYLPTPEAFDQGGMEPSLSGVTPSSEPIVRRAAIDLLAELRVEVATPTAA